MTCEMLDYVAAYVLDALEPDESARLQRHLATCDICRAELANVEWIPKLLPLVELDDLERLEDTAPEPEPAAPPPALLDRLIADATHEMRGPRGRRTAALVGAAALLLGAGGLAAVNDLPSTGAHHAKPAATAEATDPRTHVSAQVTLPGRHLLAGGPLQRRPDRHRRHLGGLVGRHGPRAGRHRDPGRPPPRTGRGDPDRLPARADRPAAPISASGNR